MARNRYEAKPPLYGMALIFVAIAIVAITATQLVGCWSLVSYACAAALGLVGAALAFRDLS